MAIKEVVDIPFMYVSVLLTLVFIDEIPPNFFDVFKECWWYSSIIAGPVKLNKVFIPFIYQALHGFLKPAFHW